MKRLFRMWPQLAVLSAFVFALALPAPAQPNTSPSAVAAARLKNKPPKNWIRHYLGDDRYKIAGGVWKVVSTELDRYYYPAWAPEMLRQKPGIVIGFASAAEAEEAGYMPSGYPMGQSLYGLTAAEIFAAKQQGTNPVMQRGRFITLSDGRSTVLLPYGWKHTKLPSQSKTNALGRSTYIIDKLSSSDNKSEIIFAFTTSLGGNFEQFLSPAAVELMNAGLKQSGLTAEEIKQREMKSTRLGGLPAISFSSESADVMAPPGIEGMMTITARGAKIYVMASHLPTNNQTYDLIAKSFQPR